MKKISAKKYFGFLPGFSFNQFSSSAANGASSPRKIFPGIIKSIISYSLILNVNDNFVYCFYK